MLEEISIFADLHVSHETIFRNILDEKAKKISLKSSFKAYEMHFDNLRTSFCIFDVLLKLHLNVIMSFKLANQVSFLI